MTGSSEGLPLTFHPRTIAQFVALHLARRFDDLKRLPQYLDVFERYPLHEVIAKAVEAHQSAQQQSSQPSDLFLHHFLKRRTP